ncbi:MAG: hypothetical protein QOE41_3019 [Mycobacterium sp.]|nr:hypothetical protein [Mycobacterium sp.]
MKQYWIECSAHRRTHQMADGKDERQRETTTDDGSHYRAQHTRVSKADSSGGGIGHVAQISRQTPLVPRMQGYPKRWPHCSCNAKRLRAIDLKYETTYLTTSPASHGS